MVQILLLYMGLYGIQDHLSIRLMTVQVVLIL